MINESTPAELYKLALNAALSCEWEKALEINLEINKLEPESTECLNRMAKAHFELGSYSKAKKIYQEVLELDPYNTIALKNLKRVSAFNENSKPKNGEQKDGEKAKNSDGMAAQASQDFISPALFVEEPGVTKAVTLVKVAEPQKLLRLSFGSRINLVAKKRSISVYDMNNVYMGALPDDFAFHLLKLIKGGNKYQAIIKSIKSNGLTILIREVFRSKKFRNQASFLDESKGLSFSSDSITLGNDRSDDDDSQEEEVVA